MRPPSPDEAYPLRLTTLSTGTTHYGRKLFDRYFIACRGFAVTPSWLPGKRAATSSAVVCLDGNSAVTCQRCLRSLATPGGVPEPTKEQKDAH